MRILADITELVGELRFGVNSSVLKLRNLLKGLSLSVSLYLYI